MTGIESDARDRIAEMRKHATPCGQLGRFAIAEALLAGLCFIATQIQYVGDVIKEKEFKVKP